MMKKESDDFLVHGGSNSLSAIVLQACIEAFQGFTVVKFVWTWFISLMICV
jgi:hypothetical protein